VSYRCSLQRISLQATEDFRPCLPAFRAVFRRSSSSSRCTEQFSARWPSPRFRTRCFNDGTALIGQYRRCRDKLDPSLLSTYYAAEDASSPMRPEPFRASSLGILKTAPSSTSPRVSTPTCLSTCFGLWLPRQRSRSVYAVSHRPDGFLHPRIAGLLHPATDHGVCQVSPPPRRIPHSTAPSEAFPPHRSRTMSPWPPPSCRFAIAGADFRASYCEKVRCAPVVLPPRRARCFPGLSPHPGLFRERSYDRTRHTFAWRKHRPEATFRDLSAPLRYPWATKPANCARRRPPGGGACQCPPRCFQLGEPP
jgi:hypothetical protein